MDIREERAKMMGEADISKVLWKLSIPGIIAMLINAIYNVVDTFFVSMLESTSAIAAVSVVFPIFILIAAIGQLFGIGSGTYISRLLGEKKKEKAEQIASTAFFITIIIGISITVIGVLCLSPLLKLFGASSTIMVHAKEYALILILGTTFTIINMLMNNMIRAEGNAKYSMIAISAGALLNIILDPIFIFGLDMGVKGASLATVIAQIISTIYLLLYFLSNKSYVKISLKSFKITQDIYDVVIKIGASSFARQFLASLGLGLINLAAKPYGDGAVAAAGISLRITAIGIFVVLGYNQGFQPLAGYNYGAKKYMRLRGAIKVALKVTTIFSILVTVVFVFFASQIMSVFSNRLEVIEIGAKFLRAMSIFFPLLGFQQVYSSLFQSLGKSREALILSIARQGLFLIPTILILPKLFALNGLVYSQTVADFFTIIITVYLACRLNKELKLEEKSYN